jgi:RsiG-like
MDDHHARSARVLDPGYIDDLDAKDVDEVRAMHAECLELETEVSYVRRLVQARIDIVEAELGRRASGGSFEDLINALPQTLADPGPRAAPASSRLPLKLAPDQESEWAPDLEETDTLLANLGSLSDDDLRDAVERLRALERDVSDERRELFGVIDRIDQDLAARLSNQ